MQTETLIRFPRKKSSTKQLFSIKLYLFQWLFAYSKYLTKIEGLPLKALRLMLDDYSSS